MNPFNVCSTNGTTYDRTSHTLLLRTRPVSVPVGGVGHPELATCRKEFVCVRAEMLASSLQDDSIVDKDQSVIFIGGKQNTRST